MMEDLDRTSPRPRQDAGRTIGTEALDRTTPRPGQDLGPNSSDGEEDDEPADSPEDEASSASRRRVAAARPRRKKPRASKATRGSILDRASIAPGTTSLTLEDEQPAERRVWNRASLTPGRASIAPRASVASMGSMAVNRGSLAGGTAAAASRASLFASELSDAAAFAAKHAQEEAAARRQRASTTVREEIAAHAPEIAKKALADGSDQARRASQAVKNSMGESADRFKGMRDQWTAHVECWAKQKVHKQIQRFIDKLPGFVKHLLEDPDMPRWISRGKDRMVDGVWPDIREELLWEIAVKLDGDTSAEPECTGPDPVRAFLRYHIYPYDKTFWGKMRDPVHVLFMLATFIPVSGVSPIMYLFIFLFIDKSDEFQLLMFILRFKGTQFISHGILRTFIGFFMFIGCVSAHGDTSRHTCDEVGPGVAGDFVLTLSGFVLQIVLVWTAFCRVPWSKEKGRASLKGSIHHETTVNSKASVQGGYVRNLMFYDLACFIVCMVALIGVWTTMPTYDAWPMRHALFAGQIIYGYLSMPFFFFTIPVLRNVLTHAMPTAYDQQGRCRRLVKPKHRFRAPETGTDEEIIESGEAIELLEKAKAMFLGDSHGLAGTHLRSSRPKATIYEERDRKSVV